MDMKKLTDYVKLKVDVKARDAQLKADKKKIEEMDKDILEMFTQSGVTNMTICGKTIFLSETLWTGALDIDGECDEKGKPLKDYERACKALKESGYGDFVREGFNAQTVSAEIRKLSDSEEGIPDNLSRNLKISPKYYVKVR